MARTPYCYWERPLFSAIGSFRNRFSTDMEYITVKYINQYQ